MLNQDAQKYWLEYWGDQVKPTSVSAFQFGDTPDKLAQLVIDGVKTATCSGHIFYELENEPLPTSDDYGIILNSDEKPVAIIKNVEVTLIPLNEVTEEFAIAEGERSYREWRGFMKDFSKVN